MANTFPNGWAYRAAITIPSSQVGSGGAVNFPWLLTAAALPNAIQNSSNSSVVAKSTGADVRFSTDLAGVNPIPCEIVQFATSAGGTGNSIQIWVRVPSISSASNTTIYIWWHNPLASMPLATDATYGSQAVWSNGFSAVYHLEAGNFTDSTATGANGTNAGSSDATGPFGGAKSFNGTTNGILLTNLHTSTTAMTLSAWAKPSSTTQAAYAKIICKTTLTNAAPYCEMNLNGAQSTGTSNVVNAEAAITSTDRSVSGTTVLSTSVFQYLAGTYNGTTLTAYYNGASEGTPGAYSGTITQTTDPINIGRAYFNNTPAQWFAGIIDEVRIASAVRNAAWLLTEYNNGNAPGSTTSAGVKFVGNLITSVY
jgi:Concanavalin A-like lectin/glucanases superfamily